MRPRPDLIGPRPLRPSSGAPIPNYIDESGPQSSGDIAPFTTPGAQNGVMPGCRPPTPPQPALVIVEPPMEKSTKAENGMWTEDSLLLYKAIRDHVDCLHKAQIAVSEAEHPHGPDVSTPQHDHARLQAKKVYLTERLAGHKNAKIPDNHPEVVQHQEALGSVETKLKDYESQGIKSGPQHHDDWMKHYMRNPEGKHSEEHVSAGLSAHTGFLGGPEVQKQRQQIAGPKTATTSTEMAIGKVQMQAKKRPPLHEAMAQLQEESRVQEKRIAQKGIRSGSEDALLMLSFVKGDEKKGDDWISNKIRLLMHEGKPQDQAIAIAYSMAGRARKSQPSLFLSV